MKGLLGTRLRKRGDEGFTVEPGNLSFWLKKIAIPSIYET